MESTRLYQIEANIRKGGFAPEQVLTQRENSEDTLQELNLDGAAIGHNVSVLIRLVLVFKTAKLELESDVQWSLYKDY